MTGEEREKIVAAMKDIQDGNSGEGLSKLADLVNPGWRKEAIQGMLSPGQAAKNPRARKKKEQKAPSQKSLLPGAGAGEEAGHTT